MEKQDRNENNPAEKGTPKKRDLWKEYCTFFEKKFAEQLSHSRTQRDVWFDKWKKTRTADHICKDTPATFEDVPVTEYSNYPAIQKFGEAMEEARLSHARDQGESWWDYYKRIEKKPAKVLEGWMPDEYAIALRTSGTSGESKWFPFGKAQNEYYRESSYAGIILGCSHEWGKSRLQVGDVMLNPTIPVPYGTGIALRYIAKDFGIFPSIEYADNETSMQKKMAFIIGELRKGRRIDVAGGLASMFNVFSKAIVEPDTFYREQCRTADWGIGKVVLYMLYLKESLRKRTVKRAGDILKLKGVEVAGFDTEIYAPVIEKQFGFLPMNLYPCSELGIMMSGAPDMRMKLMPWLKWHYFEFMDKDKNLHPIDKLERGMVYELVGSSHGSCLMRYATGDLLTVTHVREDGMPYFDFHGRKSLGIDIKNYFRVYEALAFKVIKGTGLAISDTWAFTKVFTPVERICVLMEKPWDHDEKKAAEIIFDSFKKNDQFFRNYLEDFHIKNPSEVIEVRYLPKGAFKRFMLTKMKEATKVGNFKAPRILPPERQKDTELLLRM